MIVLFVTLEDDIAPRFDLATEVIISRIEDGKRVEETRTLLLSTKSAEDLCALAVKEKISIIVCGAIEEEHYQYLQWKQIRVIDNIIGRYSQALHLLLHNKLIADSFI
ncbi:MAG: hypothetical protein GQ559_00870 [Desulfobulbaceae bacterium]|nr:hypothetical protein [Desulfobulbaceae bacterium]